MFCKICGTNNVPHASFCENCGAKLGTDVVMGEPTELKTATFHTPEEIGESKPPEKKKKSTVVLIVLIIILVSLACVAAGVIWLAPLLSGQGIGIKGPESGLNGVQSQEESHEVKPDEEPVAKTDDQIKCENLVISVLEAVKNEETDIVEECLEFECGDKDDVAKKTAKMIADYFDCDYRDFDDISEKISEEYFHSMSCMIKSSQQENSKYVVKVIHTRFDKETVIDAILAFDAESFRTERTEEYADEYDDEDDIDYDEIEEQVEEDLVKKIIEIAEQEIENATVVDNELKFVVAYDGDEEEWFILTDESEYSALEIEVAVED